MLHVLETFLNTKWDITHHHGTFEDLGLHHVIFYMRLSTKFFFEDMHHIYGRFKISWMHMQGIKLLQSGQNQNFPWLISQANFHGSILTMVVAYWRSAF